jgi:transketolase
LGQSQPTQFHFDMEEIAARWKAFGWHTISVDGHDIPSLQAAFEEARATKGQPTMVLARTLKGKGLSAIEGKEGWHGKALKKGQETDDAIAELEKGLVPDAPKVAIPAPEAKSRAPKEPDYGKMPAPAYKLGELVATREAWGTALAAVGGVDERIVALDADVKNSTFSDRFEKAHPDRFFQDFIAEQVMVGAAMGFAARGAIPFPSTFACFLTRASDFIRMAGISTVNVKLSGSHAGISIGEDGPSQMALEDLSMMRAVPDCAVLYPCDAVSTERLVAGMAQHKGLAYMRTSRPKTPVTYGPDEAFPIGGSKVLRQSAEDVATVVGVGVTVFEALKAYDQLLAEGMHIRVIDAYSVQPIDAATLVAAGQATGGRIVTVEDHYAAGGLGDAVSEAVASAGFSVHRLAVREIARSGESDELLDRYGISARHVIQAVKGLQGRG